jgi:D-xylose transport system substrate-binding protein
MYLSIPNSFLVSVRYTEDILNIKKTVILQECNGCSGFTNKLINRKDLVIGVSLPTQRDERWVRDKEAMEAYAKEKKVTLKIEDAEYDAAKQASQVENLISQGIDVLILVAVDVLTAGDMVDKANKAGVKVVAYEALIRNTDLEVFVAFSHLKAGEMQGRFLITKVPKGNYIILYADLPYDTSLKDGAMQFIQPLVIIGNIKIVAENAIKNWDPKIAFKAVENALIANNNKVDAILAPNDAIAGAAIEALEAQGLAGKVVITGQDAELAAVRRIIQGTQSMTLFKDTRESARQTIDVAIKLGNGEPVLTDSWIYNGKKHIPSILITPVLIEKNNIEAALIKSGYFKREDVYGSGA